jgi:hypothetical protein
MAPTGDAPASVSAAEAGPGDPEEPTSFQDFYTRLRAAVLRNDREYVAVQVRYPIWVDLGGDRNRRVEIKTKADLLDHYDEVFS